MTHDELVKLIRKQKAEVEAETEAESMVCPWNGFQPCFENRCPFWKGPYGCGRANMEMTR